MLCCSQAQVLFMLYCLLHLAHPVETRLPAVSEGAGGGAVVWNPGARSQVSLAHSFTHSLSKHTPRASGTSSCMAVRSKRSDHKSQDLEREPDTQTREWAQQVRTP